MPRPVILCHGSFLFQSTCLISRHRATDVISRSRSMEYIKCQRNHLSYQVSQVNRKFYYHTFQFINLFAMSPSNTPNPLPGNARSQNDQKQTYSEWAKATYNDQYEKWMPWIEDQYLKWFGKGDNKASYATKGKLYSTVPNTLARKLSLST